MATKGQINVDFALRYVGAIGANRYVANVNRYSTIAYRDILQYAARAAHVPESAVDVAMEALYDALAYFVLNGHNVKIDGIGTFAFGVNAKAEVDEDKAGADAVHRLKILYLPEIDLRRDMNNVSISTSSSNPGNLAEDANAAKWHIDVLSIGTTRTNAKAISSYGIMPLSAGTNYLIFQGKGMDKEDLRGNLEYYYDNPEDPEEPGYGTVALTSAANRVYSSYRKAIYKVEVPVDAYGQALHVNSGSFTDLQGQVFLFSFPESAPYTYLLPDFSAIGKAVLNGVEVTDNMTALPNSNGKFYLRVEGPNARTATIVATGATLVADASIVNGVRYVVTPDSGATSFTLKYPVSQVGEKTYTINVGTSSTQVVVNTLSANGVSVANGSSSTIIEGESYNFVMNGLNLNLLSADNLSVPVGSNVRNFAKSANQISFTLENAYNGAISVSYEGSTIFSVTLEAYTPETGAAAITSIGGVANNGTYHGESSQGKMTLNVKGTDLDKLTASSFTYSRSGYTFALTEGTATERVLTLNSNGSGFMGGTLRVMNGETTIFTLTIDNGGDVEF